MSIGIGFSGDPSPDDVVSLRLPNSSDVGWSEAGGGDRVGGISMDMSSYTGEAREGGSGNTTLGI